MVGPGTCRLNPYPDTDRPGPISHSLSATPSRTFTVFSVPTTYVLIDSPPSANAVGCCDVAPLDKASRMNTYIATAQDGLRETKNRCPNSGRISTNAQPRST